MTERIARQNTRWTIIDGGKVNSPEGHSIPGPLGIKKFVDGVMEKIDKESSEQSLPETETIIEFCGPKRLPRIAVVEKQPEKEEKNWKILNFFKKN